MSLRTVLSKLYALIIVLAYAILVASAIGAAWLVTMDHGFAAPADEWKTFASTATVGVTAVSAVMAAWMSIRNLTMQGRISEEVEKVKKVLDKRIPAHGDLYAAAINYYRVLVPLETGHFDVGIVEGAETKMKDSEGLTVYVSEQYADHWTTFWQRARYLKEKVHKDVHESSARIELWRATTRGLSAELSEMKRIARALFE
jgi:hypothetical protein